MNRLQRRGFDLFPVVGRSIKPMRILRRQKKGTRFVVTSTTDSRRHYVVARKGRKWACSCPAWIYVRRDLKGVPIPRRDCKHILQVKERQ